MCEACLSSPDLLGTGGCVHGGNKAVYSGNNAVYGGNNAVYGGNNAVYGGKHATLNKAIRGGKTAVSICFTEAIMVLARVSYSGIQF